MEILRKMLHKRKMLSFATLLSTLLTAAVTLWWNAQLSAIINMAGTGVMPSTAMVLQALVTMLVTSAVNYWKVYISGYTCEGMTHDLRMGYARYFASLPVAETEKMNAGEQLSKLQNEIAGVSGYLNANLFQLFDDGVRFASTFIWLLFISPALTLAANLPVFAIMMYVFWSSRVIGTAAALSRQAKEQMNRYADTLLTLFPIIRLYNAGSLTMDGFRVAVGKWEHQTIHAERIRARLMSLSALLSNIPLMLLFLVGGQMAIKGALTVGTLYIFLNLSGNVSGVMMNMPGHISAFRQFWADIKRLEGKICL